MHSFTRVFPGPSGAAISQSQAGGVCVPVWDGRSSLQSSPVGCCTYACMLSLPTFTLALTRSPSPLPRARQAPSKKMTYAVVAVASLAAVPTAFGQCPVASFDSFDFSNVMVRAELDRCAFARPDSLTRATRSFVRQSGCGSLGSAEGCDACFAALLSPAVSVLQYLPIDENSTCDSVGIHLDRRALPRLSHSRCALCSLSSSGPRWQTP